MGNQTPSARCVSWTRGDSNPRLPLIERWHCRCAARPDREDGLEPSRGWFRASASSPENPREMWDCDVEPEGIEPSFQRCERCVLPLDDGPEPRSARGWSCTSTEPALSRLPPAVGLR